MLVIETIQSVVGAYPVASPAVFEEHGDTIITQGSRIPGDMLVYFESRAIVAVQAVCRGNPEKTTMILQDVIGKAL